MNAKMAKDPAFLFYSQDFLVGTMALPFEDKGKYITLLCYMHQNGRISEETTRLLVGYVSDMLRLKFKQDSDGNWYNERLEIEVEKREKFKESRIINGSKGGRPPVNKEVTEKNKPKTTRLSVAKPTDNLIENENIVINTINYLNKKALKSFKHDTKETVQLINKLLKSKYTFEDFKKVIDVKSDNWLNDAEMNQYLRPSTLFGSKFESYLQSAPSPKPINQLATIDEDEYARP